MNIKKNPIVLALAGLLIAVGAWALHSMLNQGARDILLKFGVENVYYQNVIVIVVIVVVVGLIFGVKKLKNIWTG